MQAQQTQATLSESRSRRRLIGWALLPLIAVASLAIVAIPVWLIRPFAVQTQEGLRLSYILRAWSPIITVIALAASIFIIIRMWSGTRKWWRKAALILPLIPLVVAAWFARQNHFEWMFSPLANSNFVRPGEADFVSDTDMVLSVVLNGEAAAYPIRQIAYHHVVQDVVGGTPVVVTY